MSRKTIYDNQNSNLTVTISGGMAMLAQTSPGGTERIFLYRDELEDVMRFVKANKKELEE